LTLRLRQGCGGHTPHFTKHRGISSNGNAIRELRRDILFAVEQEAGVAGIAHVIQLSVAPVFLLSGVSAMLGVLSARLGRIIDRARMLEARALKEADQTAQARQHVQIQILARRARLISHAIALCTICALLICTVVISLFVGAFFSTDVSNEIGVVFIAALTALGGGLVTFLREVFVATRNLRIGHPQP
jgi:hypothetical protein